MLFSVTLSLSLFLPLTHTLSLSGNFLPFKEVYFVNEISLLEQESVSADSESSLEKF